MQITKTKQNNICLLLAFKNKPCGRQLSRNTCEILMVLTAAQYPWIYLHLDFSSITSYITVASLQYMLLCYIHPISMKSLLTWTRLSSTKSRKNYQSYLLTDLYINIFNIFVIIPCLICSHHFYFLYSLVSFNKTKCSSMKKKKK